MNIITHKETHTNTHKIQTNTDTDTNTHTKIYKLNNTHSYWGNDKHKHIFTHNKKNTT